MKVSIDWLKELVNLRVPTDELIRLLPLRTIGLKEVTDKYIELDMKGYNRADLLSMRGVAREVAAITGSQTTFQDTLPLKKDLPETNIKVEDSKLCPVYCIAKIENLKAGPSKPEWVKKLNDCGMRSINNIADITNLITLEYGQPMHSFDADKVADQTLVVRFAKKGEEIKTLDDKIRKLNESDLLIADSKKPLGIAGVMGGKDSEVTDSTTTIFLEAAIFDPVSTHRSSQRHGLYSEASKRFQHGLTKTNLLQALSAAIKMYEGLGGRLTGLTMVGDLDDEFKKVTLTKEKINSLIGIEIPPKEDEKHLQSLGFHPKGVGSNSWEVQVPYWRLDINIEEDLVEEVARMYGYEKIPPQKLRGKQPSKIDQKLPNYIYDLKVALKDAGLTEVQTYSFFSSRIPSTFHFSLSTLIKVANPISSETEYLRNNIWPNLVEVVAKNIRQGFKDIAIFELGKVYSPKKGNLPKEKYHLAIALMNNNDNPMAELASISRGVNLTHSRSVQLGNRNLFHPARFIPNMAEVHPRILNKFGIEKRVAIFEVELSTP